MRPWRRRRGAAAPSGSAAAVPVGLGQVVALYLSHLTGRGCTAQTVDTWRKSLHRFVAWSERQGVADTGGLSAAHVVRYHDSLLAAVKADGDPLATSSRRAYLCALRRLSRWLQRRGLVTAAVTAAVQLPPAPRRLPRGVLSEEMVGRLLAQPDLRTPTGQRDRALLELMYATGLRREEISQLQLYDVDQARGVVTVRQGKGDKDRVVPLGSWVLPWLSLYCRQGRPALVRGYEDEGQLFAAQRGGRLVAASIGHLVRRHLVAAGYRGVGSSHVLRHSMATHMLEHGADIRYIQEMLGHEQLTSTQVYTHVAIGELQRVHAATHPAERGASSPDGCLT